MSDTMSQSSSKHYDSNYFLWQSSIGEFGGWAHISAFGAYISPSDHVLDFGCGGGYLLKNLSCRKKIGVEVNPVAAAKAKENGVEVYLQVQDVTDNSVDVIISNHALEHTLHPLQELTALYQKLRKGGKIVLIVPCESVTCVFKPDNINHHLYSWSPMCLGNLLVEAGFSLIESKAYMHKWPPKYRFIATVGGRNLFEIACRVYGGIERSWSQVRAVAEKPSI